MGKYKCKICYEEFDRLLMADSCEKSHEIIYVPLYRSDLARLIQFIFTGDKSLITERLGKTLMKYKKDNK